MPGWAGSVSVVNVTWSGVGGKPPRRPSQVVGAAHVATGLYVD